MKFSEFTHGKGLWKHNNALLSDVEYLEKNKHKITEIKTQYCLPIYNTEAFTDINDSEIQFVIDDQLFFRNIANGIARSFNFVR